MEQTVRQAGGTLEGKVIPTTYHSSNRLHTHTRTRDTPMHDTRARKGRYARNGSMDFVEACIGKTVPTSTVHITMKTNSMMERGEVVGSHRSLRVVTFPHPHLPLVSEVPLVGGDVPQLSSSNSPLWACLFVDSELSIRRVEEVFPLGSLFGLSLPVTLVSRICSYPVRVRSNKSHEECLLGRPNDNARSR